MKTAARWRAGSASDPGLQRTINEDRVWLDDARGVFLVVDGLGGHAAGEIAASTAVDVVRQTLRPETVDLDAHLRQVICTANNEIFRLAQETPAWGGMACVMTLAVVQDDQAVVGHVGDSRLYVFWNGKLAKMTPDHSPVGEQEDQGLLTEEQAMSHPRRNEVFRDVGSEVRRSDDTDFIEIRRFVLREESALLLCSDGLTDCVNAAGITNILEQFDGDAGRTAQMLVEAANAAGGKDNISVIFAAGPDFAGTETPRLQDARSRHATTRARTERAEAGSQEPFVRSSEPELVLVRGDRKPGGSAVWLRIALIVLVTAGLAVLVWRFVFQATAVPPIIPAQTAAATAVKHVIEVNAADARGIIDALSTATSGQTILVPAGEFLGPLILRDGVDLVAKDPRETVVRNDPSASAEQGIVIVARGVKKALVNGLRVLSDETHPLKTGVLIVDSSVDLVDLEISGAVYSGIHIEGNSAPRITECFIHANGGAGVSISDNAAPVLRHNQIIQNGLMVNSPRPGIETGPHASPILEDNLLISNGTDEPMKGSRSKAKLTQEKQQEVKAPEAKPQGDQ